MESNHSFFRQNNRDTQETMGIDVYARQAAQEKQKIVAMYSLETIGYFRADAGSQQYPPLFNLFYPRAWVYA